MAQKAVTKKQKIYVADLPELLAEWHGERNAGLDPAQIAAGSKKKAWWRCSRNASHEWEASICHIVRKNSGCPYCSGRRVTQETCLETQFPEIAQEWHPTKNGKKTPADVHAGAEEKAWWQCSKNASHEWEAKIDNRTRKKSGCPYCAGKHITKDNCLATVFPDIAQEWHPTKNGKKIPADAHMGSHQKVWWQCSINENHEWEARINERTRNNRGCPYCTGRLLTQETCLATVFPKIAKEWHPTKNRKKTPADVHAGSHKKAWWRCSKNDSHEWEAVINSRTRNNRGCPYCNAGWTIEKIRLFVQSLMSHLESLSSAELYLICKQNGLLDSSGKGRVFVEKLKTGRFPREELQKFVEGEASLVDQVIAAAEEGGEEPAEDVLIGMSTLDEVAGAINDMGMPLVHTKDLLTALDAPVVVSADREKAEFLIASKLQQIWRHAFRNEAEAVAEAQAYNGGEYAMEVQQRFLSEYRAVAQLKIPRGYAFKIKGKTQAPNLMQKLVAVLLRDRKQLGNWSGTGSGKTLSAVLASRVIGAQLTVICCPNSIVNGWRNMIRDIYPDSDVQCKTFHPQWRGKHRYLVLNYEAFQQEHSEDRVLEFVKREQIDLMVIDEIHHAKQRCERDDAASKRKQMVLAMIKAAKDRNADAHVLAMSATPVVNELQEGKSLVEMITTQVHDDIKITPKVEHCMYLYQMLVNLGVRWMPDYGETIHLKQTTVEVDCAEYVDQIRSLGPGYHALKLEQILTQARLPAILAAVEPKTIIYTNFVDGIANVLYDALKEEGWHPGFYTGEVANEREEMLEDFLDPHGSTDVLIGSSAISTGVDRLQSVCKKMIINVLPWTHAEFEQLQGRIYRQGQASDQVEIVIPMTYAMVNGQRWSWCESKMHRINWKKSIADAAVDGVVPEGHLVTPSEAYKAAMGWLERLQRGEENVIQRDHLKPLLIDDDHVPDERGKRRPPSAFSRLNNTWNRMTGARKHDQLMKNPEEWHRYHDLFRQKRAGWNVVPVQEMIRWFEQRQGYMIGDFGCGDAELAEALRGKHTVVSLDHVAINDQVIVCDLSQVPQADASLDAVVFSLSLMGSNFVDYIREAFRCLRLDGQIHIIEGANRFKNKQSLEAFQVGLKQMGFAGVEMEHMWKFVHIHARKATMMLRQDVTLEF